MTGHGYPPPPPQPYSTPQGRPQPRPKPRVLTWVLIAVAVSVVLVAGVVIAVLMLIGRDTVPATEIQEGACLADIPSNDRVQFVHTVTCDQPHQGEVFAVLTMPDGAFPGDAAVSTFTDTCHPVLTERAPGAAADPTVSVFVLYPTSDSWTNGDRTVTCIATTQAPRTGKMR